MRKNSPRTLVSHGRSRMDGSEATYGTQPSSAALYVARVRQFDVRATVPQAVDSQLGQGDQKLFRLTRGELHVEDSMSDLSHDNRTR